MLKKLIINSDDFGMTEGNTLGTLFCHTDGSLTSTTTMMNMPFAAFALEEAKKHPDLGIGIHFVLTAGQPLLKDLKSLVDENGNFYKWSTYSSGSHVVDQEELYQEWKAQMELFIKLYGQKPTHIDSHHHVHAVPHHQPVALRLGEEYDLPIRQDKHVDQRYEFAAFKDGFYGDDLTVEGFIDMIKSCPEEIAEFMAHPAFLDERLYNMSAYGLPRMKEMEILRSPTLKNFLEDNNIQLITYKELAKLK